MKARMKGGARQTITSLNVLVQAWPTPNALDGEKAPEKFAGGNPSLPAAAKTWATPTAQPSNGDAESFLRRKGRKPGGAITDLGAQITTWPTPTSLSFGASHQPGNSRSYNKTMEMAAGINWSTPSVADVMGGRKARSGSRADEALMNGQALALSSGLLAPETSTPGDMSPSSLLACYRRYRATTDCALRWERRALLLLAIRRRDALAARKPAKHGGAQVRVHRRGWTRERASAWVRPTFRRQLNARFVEWLMSWPPGLTSFECSETALLTHKALWRSELALMTSLPAAPPAQLSLFG